MANNQSTFIALPVDVTNPLELRRFLDKLVQQLDIAFGNRGQSGFALNISFIEVINILNDHEVRLDNIENILPGLLTSVQNLNNGELILSVAISTVLSAVTETVLCDCTNGTIEITLPSPIASFNSGRSKILSISKIDKTRNKVRILPNLNEVIAGNKKVDLILENEVLNLVTNGTNWYLGG